MRVLHVEVGGSYGGSLRALETYLRYCDRSAMEHAVLLYYPTPGAERLAELVEVRTLFDHTPRRIREDVPGSLRMRLGRSALMGYIRPWRQLWGQIPSLAALGRAFSGVDPDLVHVNNTFPYQAATMLAARVARIPVLAHVRNPVEATAFNRRLARLARSLVAVNRGLACEIAGWRPAVPVHTCHDGSETPAVDAGASEELRRDFIGSGAILAGSLGRLDAQKGYEGLIEAARLVCAAHPGVRFAIAGEGPLRNRLQARIESLGLAAKVRLCGFRADPANFLAALDLFVCSSVYEGGPLVLAEAMALRKPVVSTAVGFVSELVQDPAAGVVVPCGDTRAMAAAILGLLDPPADRACGLERARLAALRLCDPVAAARRLDECFCESVRMRPAAGRIRTHAA